VAPDVVIFRFTGLHRECGTAVARLAPPKAASMPSSWRCPSSDCCR